MLLLPAYIPHMPVIAYRERPPIVERVTPQPLKEVETFSIANGIVTSAENVYRRRMVDLGQTVSLMNGRVGQIVSLKPAKGELMRHPTKFAVVTWNEDTKHREEYEIKAWQPLKVV